MRQDGIDVRAFVCGIALSGVLSVGFATAVLYLSRSSDDPHVGPTAASLDDGLSTFFGAAFGLALASVLIAAVVAYLVVLVPLLLATRPYDVDVGETLATAVGLGVLVAPVIAIASAFGAGAGHVLRGRRA